MMSSSRYSREEVAKRGEAIYEQSIKSQVEPDHVGEYVVIDVETGEYEIDSDDVAVMKRAAKKHRPDVLYGKRIGYHTMGRIGLRATNTGG